MKGKIYSFSIIGLLSLFGVAILINNYQKPVYQPKEYSDLHNDLGSAKYAIQYRQLMLQDKNGEVNLKDILKARRAVENHYSSKAPADRLFFEEMGPNFVGGRTRGIIQDNQTGNESVLYAGTVGGGVWITYNGGEQWYDYSSDLTNLFVGDVGQTSDGTLFVGTGEGFGSTGGNISSSVFTGDGLFRRVLDGNNELTYERLIGPSSRPSQPNSQWSSVQRIIGHPTDPNKLYVATSSGLMVTANAQASASEISFFNGIEIANGIFNTSQIDDLAVTADGNTVYAVAGATIYKMSDAGGANMTLVNTISLPPGNGNISRVAIAVAPSDNNVLYAAASSPGSSDCTYGVFQSKDAGDTWNTISSGAPSSLYQSAGCQGFWDNCISVFPNDAGKIIVAGVSIYKWEESKTTSGAGGWFKIALIQTEGTSGALTDTNYVHADKHRILFTDSNTIYIASDGGIGKSFDGGNTWGQNNNGLIVTQFYSVSAAFGLNFDTLGIGITEQVIGGSQDNGTWLIGTNANSLDRGFQVSGGDGFDAEFSNIASLAFVTSQNLNLRRVSFGSGGGNIFDAEIRTICQGGCGAFYSRLGYWEDAYTPFSYDSILFFAGDSTYQPGSILSYNSRIANIPMSFITPNIVKTGDSIKVPDYAQSKLVIALDPNGGTRGVYMTRDGANVNEINPSWDLIADASNSFPDGLNASVFKMKFSADGNQLFLGMTNGSVYRVDNINQGYDSLTLDIRSEYSVLTCTRIMPGKGAYVSSISVDPNDPNNLVITYPGIGGNAARVYRISNAAFCLTDQANDQPIQGNLPVGVPVYSSIISDHNNNTVIVGTEYGIYATDDAFSSPSPSWNEGWGIPKIAIYDMVQQTNRWLYGDNGPQIAENAHYRKIYLGTHGRGFWKTASLVGIDEGKNSKTVSTREEQIQFKVYPNPLSETGFMEIDLIKNETVTIDIYDLTGKVVLSLDNNTLMPEGLNKIQFNVRDLRNGTYIATMRTNDEMKVSKFVVLK